MKLNEIVNVKPLIEEEHELAVVEQYNFSQFESPYNGNINASGQRIKSLKNCPSIINGEFDVSYNELKNLKGGPSVVKGLYNIRFNEKLTSLEGIPKKLDGSLTMGNLPKLQSLDFAPEDVNGYVSMSINRARGQSKITSFTGCGKKFFRRINGSIVVLDSLTSNILGLMLVKDLTEARAYNVVSNELFQAIRIVDGHIKVSKDIMECREELIVKGLKEFAKL